MKVVINKKFGSFELSRKATEMLAELGNEKAKEHLKYVSREPEAGWYPFYSVDRDDPKLVQVVEALGEEANTHYSKLLVVDIPEGCDWVIQDKDGYEKVCEPYRTFG